MLDVVSINKDAVKYRVNAALLELLEEFSIFQSRDSSDTQDKFSKRWKLDSILSCLKTTETEPFSVNGGGNTLYAAGSFCDIVSAMPASCTVGRYTSIAAGLGVMGVNHPVDAAVMSCLSFSWRREIIRAHSEKVLGLTGEPPNFKAVKTPQPRGGLKIGNDVWIGSNATFKSNVTIGNGAVVAANSVVAKDVPPYAIVVGNSSRIAKFRFSTDVIELMEASAWWEHSPDILRQFDMSNPEKFASDIIACKQELPKFLPEKLNVWSVFSQS